MLVNLATLKKTVNKRGPELMLKGWTAAFLLDGWIEGSGFCAGPSERDSADLAGLLCWQLVNGVRCLVCVQVPVKRIKFLLLKVVVGC